MSTQINEEIRINISQVTINKSAILTAIKMMLAAVFAFQIYQTFNLNEGYWSVVTIAAVTQVGFAKTVTKGLMRLIGTFIGAVFGYGLAVLTKGEIATVIILFFIVITVSSYIAIQPTLFSYGGIITGLTTVIVLSSSLITGQLFPIAVDRTIEVTLGIIILFILNFCMAIVFKNFSGYKKDLMNDIKSFPSELKNVTLRFAYLKSAIKIALACLITFVVWIYFRQPGGFWATVSCLLIMEESMHSTKIKAKLRFFAHLLAAILGGAIAVLIGSHTMWLVVPLSLSFLICGYIIGTRSKYASLGNTMGIALAIMLLASPGTSSTLHIIFYRFINVMFGISVALFLALKSKHSNSIK